MMHREVGAGAWQTAHVLLLSGQLMLRGDEGQVLLAAEGARPPVHSPV